MNTKKISKNSGVKQTIHIDELLNDKQNYQACQDFSVDEKLKTKLSNIPYVYAQQTQQQATQKTYQENTISFWKNIQTYFSGFQWHFQPRYAMLGVGVLFVGILGYMWFNPQTPLSEKTVYYDAMPFSAVEYEAVEDQDIEYRDIQPAMLKGETCDDCDGTDEESIPYYMDSSASPLNDKIGRPEGNEGSNIQKIDSSAKHQTRLTRQEGQGHIQEKHENKENQKTMKENIFSAVLLYVVKLLFFSL